MLFLERGRLALQTSNVVLEVGNALDLSFAVQSLAARHISYGSRKNVSRLEDTNAVRFCSFLLCCRACSLPPSAGSGGLQPESLRLRNSSPSIISSGLCIVLAATAPK